MESGLNIAFFLYIQYTRLSNAMRLITFQSCQFFLLALCNQSYSIPYILYFTNFIIHKHCRRSLVLLIPNFTRYRMITCTYKHDLFFVMPFRSYVQIYNYIQQLSNASVTGGCPGFISNTDTKISAAFSLFPIIL